MHRPAVPEPPLAQTLEQLRRLARQAPDASGCFPAMYADVTAAVQQRLVSGHFADPARDRAGAAGCWRASWDVAGHPGLLIAQHLLLGINAHVNHDLPQAVVAEADRTRASWHRCAETPTRSTRCWRTRTGRWRGGSTASRAGPAPPRSSGGHACSTSR